MIFVRLFILLTAINLHILYQEFYHMSMKQK